MDDNNYSYQHLFGTLPSEYRMWYTTQLLTTYDSQGNAEREADGATNSGWQTQIDSTPDAEFAPEVLSSEEPNLTDEVNLATFDEEPLQGASGNQWNYLYYLQMLSEMEHDKRFAHLSSNGLGTKDTPDSNFSTVDQLVAEPSELYSSKVKKGLECRTEAAQVCTDFLSPEVKPKSGMEETGIKEEPKVPQVSNKRVFKKTKQPLGDVPINKNEDTVFCKNCKSCSSPVLNNSFTRVPCPSGNKCLLNVNNNLHKKCKSELKPDSKENVTKKHETEKKPTRQKVKIRNVQTCDDEDSLVSEETPDVKSKKRNVPTKSRLRLVRGKLPRHNQRKRHSDVEKVSTVDNLVAFFRTLIGKLSQLPTQPWFKHMLDSLTSLIGVIIGSIWLLVFIVWEGLKSGYGVSCKSLSSALLWVKTNASYYGQMLFLYIPGLDSTSGNKNATDETNGEKLPTNGDDAVRRLLHLKGQDPYSILGITPMASDEDIKRRYKSQAVLVHPDKNHYSGAEEAFKVLASAFDVLGNPEKRNDYDQEHNLKEEDEITSFLEKIQKNIDEMQSILGCHSCGKNHKRYKTERQANSARYCSSCKTFHAAREGDLWAETTMLGFKWHYYAYLDKSIFDITEWVTCQENLMSTIEANSHSVTCRLATPKGKNRNGTYSRMQDLKDLVNDLLQKSRQPSQEAAGEWMKTGTDQATSRNKGRRHSGPSGSRKRK